MTGITKATILSQLARAPVGVREAVRDHLNGTSRMRTLGEQYEAIKGAFGYDANQMLAHLRGAYLAYTTMQGEMNEKVAAFKFMIQVCEADLRGDNGLAIQDLRAGPEPRGLRS